LIDTIMVSRDTREFVAAGVPVFDPWDWTLHAGGRVAVAQAHAPAHGERRNPPRPAPKLTPAAPARGRPPRARRSPSRAVPAKPSDV
jgi:hypothetical protein